jgi:glutamate/tyrosine decarboxylase-like PLP-dependent enzyme
MIMTDWINEGFLGDDPSGALGGLSSSFNEQVLPFLADWWSSPNPIPTEAEVAAIRAGIEERKAATTPSPAYEKLPDLLSALAEGMRFNRRNFVNIHPSPFVPSALASFIVALQNSNNIVEEVSKATWELERDCVEWMGENLFGIDRGGGIWGNIVSGGTIANMTALLVARDYTYDKLSRPQPARIGARGVIDQRPGVVLGTAATHYSLQKALWFLGLGHENLVRVPVCWDENVRRHSYKDDRFVRGVQSEPWKALLRKAVEHDSRLGEQELAAFYRGEQCPFGLQPLDSEILKTLYSCFEFGVPLIACVLTLGTTDTGTIERMDSFAIEQLRNEDIYIHVDGASGGFAFLSEHVKPHLHHLEHVDSFTVDAHKTGFLHYPCGAVVFRDKGFREQIYHEAPYLGPLAPTLEGSRAGSGAAALWLAKETIGAEGYRSAVNRLLNFTKRLVKAFESSGKYQVLHKVDLNAVAVAPLPQGETRREINRLVNKVRERVVAGGEFLVNLDRHLSGVKVLNDPEGSMGRDGEIVDIEALRIVITNPLVQQEGADRLVTILVQYLDEERAKIAGE